MSHSQLSLFLLFCISTSVRNLADIVHLWSFFQRLKMNHQTSIYCLLCNRNCEHGKNQKKGEPLISKQV